MTMGWIEELRQTAVIDEAEQLARRYLLPEFADVRALYATVGFDAQAFATKLLADATAARVARGQAAVSQAAYEVESGHSRDAVAETGKYLETARLAGRYAQRRGHPLGDHLERLSGARDLSADSWSRARDSLDAVLRYLRTTDLAGTGLPADFVARGEALAVRLDQERTDTAAPWLGRTTESERLQQLLSQIVEAFEDVAAARDLAMSITGQSIPGLELSLVRGAAAPAAPPAPVAPSSAAAGDTGL